MGMRSHLIERKSWTNCLDRGFQISVLVCLLVITAVVSTSAWYTHQTIHAAHHTLTHTIPAFVECTEASLRDEIPDLVMPKAYTDIAQKNIPACKVLASQVLAPAIGRNDSQTGSIRSLVKNIQNDHGKLTRTLSHVEDTTAQVHTLTTHLVGNNQAGSMWPLVHELPNLITLADDLQALAHRVRTASNLIITNLEQVALPKMLNLSNALPTPDRMHSALNTVETTLNNTHHLSSLLDGKLALLFGRTN